MRLEAATRLNQSTIRVGEQVTVDGMNGRGMVVKRVGDRVTVKYRNGEYISRDVRFVHSFTDNTYRSRYQTVQAKEFKPEARARFQGMDIVIENDKGSLRTGVDKNSGQPWKTEMKYPYGEIKDSVGLDGDPVDVYLGDDKGAKFAYVVHQLKPQSGEWDEDKVMLGFMDALDAKRAYMVHYDEPEKFFGSIDAIPMSRFKELIRKKEPIKISGGAVNIEREGGPVRRFKPGAYMVKVGTQFCVRSTNEVDANFGCYPSREEARKNMGTLQGKGGGGAGGAGGGRGGPGLREMGVRTPKDPLGNYEKYLHPGVVNREQPRAQKNAKSSEYHDKFRKEVSKTKYDKRKERLEAHSIARGWQYRDSGGPNVQQKHPFPPSPTGMQTIMPSHPMAKGVNKLPAKHGPTTGTRLGTSSQGKSSLPGMGRGGILKSESQYGTTGWQYGKRSLARYTGYVPAREMAGFPATGGGRGGARGFAKPAPSRNLLNPKISHGPGRGTSVGTAYPKLTMPKGTTGGGFGGTRGMGRGGMVKGYGTSEGADKGWDTRGRGRKMSRDEMLNDVARQMMDHYHEPQEMAERGGKPDIYDFIDVSKTNWRANMPHDEFDEALGRAVKLFKEKHGNQLKGYADYGEPLAGAMGHGHIDPVTWFHPPSLTKRTKSNEETRIPTDDVREDNDKFLDVTKRDSPDTKEFRMKLLKHEAPNSRIPARTTLMEPHSAIYQPLYSSASGKKPRRMRSVQGRQFTSYERRGVI